MVKGNEFNKEMASYLSKRPRKSRFSFFRRKTPVKDAYEEYEQLAGVSETKPTVIGGTENVIQTMKRKALGLLKQKRQEEIVPAFDEQGNLVNREQPQPDKISGFVSKIDVFDVLGKKKEQVAEAEYHEMKEFEEVVHADNDIRELARISANILRLLPPEKLEDFKAGQDFNKYKELLKKHHIIK
ncbi:hypothetical protein J4457_01270 [Candidatus Woesearchaeota archaeon]|nr:hypothetical protein [Candidatus Woesearchaeota archaeon]